MIHINHNALDLDTEIRKLPQSVRNRLSHMLEVNSSWKLLMGLIPQVPGDSSTPPKYTSQDVRTIEDEAKRQGKPAFDILIDEWGTSGKQRAKVRHLLQLLVEIEHFQAADYVSKDLLNGSEIERPSQGPGAHVRFDLALLKAGDVRSGQDRNTNSDVELHERLGLDPWARELVGSAVRDHLVFDTHLPQVSYRDLEFITEGFNLTGLTNGGRCIGAGAFGTVFLGKESTEEDPLERSVAQQFFEKLKLSRKSKVAVKRLHNQKADFEIDVLRLFQTEVETMSKFNHENLLTLLAYSSDGPECCLIYPYMPIGSLEARLATESAEETLQWGQRLDIAQGLAAALVHLHTALEKPLVHRDVKSANVLLDDDFRPKLADFGLVRIGASGRTKSVALTSKILGTSAYMAPEGFRGDVSIKLDTFSFGVVLLELLTGLPPYSENREGNDLISHVDFLCDEKDFLEILDPRVPPLPEDMAGALHTLAMRCLQDKKKRPTMEVVLKDLRNVGRPVV